MAQKSKLSRRKFIQNSSYAAGGIIGGGLLGSLGGFLGKEIFGHKTATTSTTQTKSVADESYNHAFMYFTNPATFEVLKSAIERIYPEDENGPGATGLGVHFFIDHQLAGAYGQNAREYMQGPFAPGSNFQGYQSPLKRHQVFDVGLDALQTYSQKQYKKDFPDITDEQKDTTLKAFAEDKVQLKGVTSKTFFSMLRALTLEGVYSDPLYGGNRNMQGWKMKKYPGSQMAYIQQIESKKFQSIKPQSLNKHFNHS
ncbi:gluconate 2-dehydrogenase subunit 3 family protein [Bacillus sp. USDA818B3_A]|uniref:gluconate 2-dehydrogenase subunit 3 family protein n=1 Tax=Bacillus sp. USDA818B3_A TaxID=2698834 RepID=UPI00136C8D9A|nr:gluconate 2-dehydrogenase subunit 3 family protein [Bacillus sp. USDA818B3_A]